MEMNYCRRCGAALSNESSVYRCENGHIHFLNPKPTVGILFLRPYKRTVLLSRRGIEPRKGELDMIGGFVDENESFEESALREIGEETGLTPDDFSPLNYLVSAPNDYAYGGETFQVLSVIYYAFLHEQAAPIAADDVAELVEIDILDVDTSKITAKDDVIAINLLQEKVRNNDL